MIEYCLVFVSCFLEFLRIFDHRAFNVFHRTARLLAGVQYSKRIEYLFYFREKLDHAGREHEGEIRGAHDAVVVLTSD